MQIQLDPNIPTNLSPEQLRDFKTFLDHALDALSAAAGNEIFTMGNAMLGFLAVIVVVLTGLKTAFSGNIQPWELVRVVIGIWIPWVMLQFYTTTIPGMIHTFPGMIAAGGNWLHELLIGDSLYAVQSELTDLFKALAKGQDAAAKQGDLLNIVSTGLHASMTAIVGFVMVLFMAFMLLILAAVTYAQVIWAQVALAILIILGPIFIPFLVFDPLSFLFWGWFRAMLTYSFYAVIAGAVLRVFSAVGIAYITSLATFRCKKGRFGVLGGAPAGRATESYRGLRGFPGSAPQLAAACRFNPRPLPKPDPCSSDCPRSLPVQPIVRSPAARDTHCGSNHGGASKH